MRLIKLCTSEALDFFYLEKNIPNKVSDGLKNNTTFMYVPQNQKKSLKCYLGAVASIFLSWSNYIIDAQNIRLVPTNKDATSSESSLFFFW